MYRNLKREHIKFSLALLNRNWSKYTWELIYLNGDSEAYFSLVPSRSRCCAYWTQLLWKCNWYNRLRLFFVTQPVRYINWKDVNFYNTERYLTNFSDSKSSICMWICSYKHITHVQKSSTAQKTARNVF